MFMSFGLSWLVVSRVLHGAASAAIMISSMFLVTVKVPRQDYGASMGWITLALTLGCLFGSGCGGPLHEHAGAIGILAISEVILLVCFYLATRDDSFSPQDDTHSSSPREDSAIRDNQDNGDNEDESVLTVVGRRMKKQLSTFIFLIRQPVVLIMFFSMVTACTVMACLEAVRLSTSAVKIRYMEKGYNC
jgi:MFS family permease